MLSPLADVQGKSLWSHNPIPNGCVLYLPFWHPDLAGAQFDSIDPQKHICSVTGATWSPDGRDFVSTNPDYIALNDGSVDSPLNFTSVAFSIVARINVDNLGSGVMVFSRGGYNQAGYELLVNGNGGLWALTYQTDANQQSTSLDGGVVTGNNYTIGLSRSGAGILLYINGIDVTSGAGTHTNPASSSYTSTLGVRAATKTTNPYDGGIKAFAVYDQAISAGEQAYIHSIWSQR